MRRMKILVFSDSHGVVRYMQAAIDAQRPDRVFHLGDMMRDAMALHYAVPDLPMDGVCGNCDGWGAQSEELLLDLCGHRVMLTHGHLYHVKSGLALAERTAREKGAEVLLFGHTHQPLVDRQGALWIMNPGSIRGWGMTTYGVLTLDREGIDCRIAVVDQEKGDARYADGN